MAICVGCNRDSSKMLEYSKEMPVEDDGTYADGKFVCTACYLYLIDLGLDVGSPREMQANALRVVRPLNDDPPAA